MYKFDMVIERAKVALAAYHGNDPLEKSRIIATASIEIYGDFQEQETWDRFRKNGIWNDHAAVQAAYAAIMLLED